MWRRALTAGLRVRGMATKKKKSPVPPNEVDGKTRFDVRPFDPFLIDSPMPYAYSDQNELLEYFRIMYRMRRMEIAADNLYKGQQIRGFCHLYDGQEAVAVGMDAILTFDDPLITAYRNHCQMLSRGSNVKEILAELTGRYAGVSKGKGGSMHMYNRKNNYYGGNGIVGAQVPLGAGLAFALKYEKKANVAVTMFGDGAANQGQIAEAINMAVIWKLPILFVCENNQYGMGTSALRASATQDFYKRENYIPGLKMDGMDVLAVREGVKFAKEYAVKNGPLYIEMDTYRYHGHSMSDPGVTYRSKDEINDIKKSRDPIDRVKERLIEKSWSTAEDLKAIEKEIKIEVDEAAAFSKIADAPPVETLYHHIYQEESPIRGTLLNNGTRVGFPST
eukprot:CAMPEP_0184746248 /NCGR_PEP_ID=MMETSP0315-20130426/8790_1 /TAXON_ID=101924 /ORGANISM="Rhodosorus marinus, Strain UTEX LB 2760" /LENGTH=390 /DNA_ID=CAMNT_0027218705 /DNA_START=177 /DNA_END=1349 /DNA_ORIENTATION=+